MPSHEPDPPADPSRRAKLLAGVGLFAAGLPVISGLAAAGPAIALPDPPAGAQPVDWDHFGEPSASAARRANVAASRALVPTSSTGETVDTQLYRLPGEAGWEQVLGHYQHHATPAWKPVAGAARFDTGHPARQQRFAFPWHRRPPSPRTLGPPATL